MAILNKDVGYSVEGLTLIRSNPDGTPALPSRILGFGGTVDLTSFGTSAELVAKIDTGAAETKTIDYTAAVDQSAVTVAEMVTAITTAAFTDLTASVDSSTGRLLIVYSGSASPEFLQILDGVDDGFAAALDFGQGQKYGGPGAKYVTAFDNVVSIELPQNIKDKEENEQESGDGTYTSIVHESITKGRNPVVTFNDKDFRIMQLIAGGVYDEATNKYTPPTTDQTNKPIFTMNIFHDIYDKGAGQPREDKKGVERRIEYNCTGNMGDLTLTTKAFRNYVFNVTSGEWRDENGVKQAYETIQNLSIVEYEALDVENL